MKKSFLFLFALGFSASFAFAGTPECYELCDVKMDACLDAGTNPRGCVHQWEKCYDQCADTAP